MNTLLIFFALPVATIILAIVLEKIIQSPILTAATFFAIYLIVAFAAFDATFLIYVILYTLIAYAAAVLASLFFNRNIRCCIKRKLCSCNSNENGNDTILDTANVVRLTNSDINAIANQIVNMQDGTDNSNSNCSCNNNQNTIDNTLAVNVRGVQTGNRSSWCCYRR